MGLEAGREHLVTMHVEKPKLEIKAATPLMGKPARSKFVKHVQGDADTPNPYPFSKERAQRRDPPEGQANTPCADNASCSTDKFRARRLGRRGGEVQPAIFERAAAALQARQAETEAEAGAPPIRGNTDADADIDLYVRVVEEAI